MTANRNMLKNWIAVTELRTVSVLQEARHLVIQCVARGKKGSES